jgi:predicted PurR-regulated permease PerM
MSTVKGDGIWTDGLGRAAIRSLQLLLVMLLIGVVTYVAIRLRLLVVPLLIATLVAAAASPLVGWLGARGIPRILAVWMTLLSLFAVLGGLGWFVGAAVRDEWEELREGTTDGLLRLRDYLTDGPLDISDEQIAEGQQRLRELAQGGELQAGAWSGAILVIQLVTGLFLGLVLLFFLLKDGSEIWGFLREQLPERHRDLSDSIAGRSVDVLGGYVRGTAIIALVDTVVIGLALLILGVPLALPLSIVVFVGAFVPLLGATVAGAVATLVALATEGPVTALIVLAVVVAVNQIEGDVLAPVVLGRSLSLHPIAILLALTAGTIVAGIIGAILAVPFTAVVWSGVTAYREAAAAEP